MFEYVTQNNAVYGISRISSKKPGSKSYTYDSSGGEGTCVYIVDTGIDDTHKVRINRLYASTPFLCYWFLP